jgi:Flp pilus assembly protein TadD
MARRQRAAADTNPAGRATWLDRHGAWLVPAGVLVVTVLTFLPALSGQFLTWDDDRNFLMNVSYRGLGRAELKWMFTTFHLGPYQPLSWMTLGFDYTVWGMDPFGYHLTSLMIHTVNAWLVYVLALRLRPTDARSALGPDSGARVAAGVAALVFAIHPLRVESVAWVTERRDVLSGFFAILTMIAYVRMADLKRRGQPAGTWLAAAIALFALSLLSKASAMALPLVLLLIDLLLLRRSAADARNPNAASVRDLVLEKTPFAVLSIATAVAALVGQKTVEVLATMDREGPLQRVARAFYGLAFYLWKSLVPVDLSNLYEVPFRTNAFDVHFLLSAAAVIALTVLTFLLRKRRPAVFVAWMSYALLLLPVSGIAHGGGQIVADRYSYIPCLSLALLAGGGALVCWHAARDGRLGRGYARLVAGALAAILVAFASMASAQTRIWHDSTTLWQHAFALHPIERLRTAGTARATELAAGVATIRTLGNLSAYWAICYNLGTALRADGHSEDAATVYAHGADANPINADVRNSWAAALTDLHRYDDAALRLDEAIRIEPAHAKAHFNLGLVRAAQGRQAEAIAAYGQAIALEPTGAEAHYNLGVLLAGADRLDDAVAEYRRAVAIRPDYTEAYNNLGVALGRQGRISEAVDAFRRSLAITPGNASAERNLAQALDVLKGKR